MAKIKSGLVPESKKLSHGLHGFARIRKSRVNFETPWLESEFIGVGKSTNNLISGHVSAEVRAHDSVDFVRDSTSSEASCP